MMNLFLRSLIFTAAFFSVVQGVSADTLSHAEKLRRLLLSGDTNYVFVAAHRMDWRNHPENSLSSAKSAIAMGVDILEIDVAITSDDKFVLLHDTKLDRTTDGSGLVKDFTLNEIKKYRLRERLGGKNAPLTEEHVATLEEVLLYAKGKCLINIDKFTRQSAKVLRAIKRLGMERQVICKAGGSPDRMRQLTGEEWKAIDSGEVIYMPIVVVKSDSDGIEKPIGSWRQEKQVPRIYEVCLRNTDGDRFFEEFFALPERPRLWLNTMWGGLNNNHTREDKKTNFEEGWDWFLSRGATVLQTDRPAALIEYLKKKGRRTLPDAGGEKANP